MDNTNFIYWLQGWFELNNESSTPIILNLAHIRCIERHLNLVSQETAWQSSFASWIKGLFARINEELPSDPGDIEDQKQIIFETETRLIKEELARELKKVTNRINVIKPDIGQGWIPPDFNYPRLTWNPSATCGGTKYCASN